MNKITSNNNPLIKEVKALSRRKDRWIRKEYIIEGTKPIKEAVYEKAEIISIFYSKKLLERKEGEELFNYLKGKCKVIELEDSLFQTISSMENSQGIFAVLRFKESNLYNIRPDKPYIYLDEIQDPGNMGTIIRSADAFSMGGLILSKGCVDPYNPKVVRASMGSIFRVDLIFNEDLEKGLCLLKEKARRLVVTSLEKSIDISEFTFLKDDIIVIGNEGRGVSKPLLELADSIIKIPMKGMAESLNAGVASSIIMYEISHRVS